jgi:hypothetical protein
MARKTIAALEALLEASDARNVMLGDINAAQAARIADLEKALATAPAQKPAKPAAKRESRIGQPCPNRQKTIGGVLHQAVWRSDTDNVIGWQPV